MSRHNRRQFLKTTAVAASALAVPMVASSRVLVRNDTIHIAVAGINGRGGRPAGQYVEMKGVQIAIWSTRLPAVREPQQEHQGKGRQHAQVRAGHPQGPGRQEPRRRLDRHPQPLARSDHSGPARRARTCTSRSRAATTSSRAASCVEAARKYNRIVQHGTQSRSDAELGQSRWPPSAAASTASCWSPTATPASRRRQHRLQAAQGAAQGVRLQPLARPGARAAVPREPRPLQLALVLGLRQRRDRQPGRAPDGHRPLGHARRRRAEERRSASAAASATRTRARRPTRS